MIYYIFVESILSRKTVAEAFWNYHIEEELRERCMIHTTTFRKEGDREIVMKEIECFRKTTTYLHNYCDEKCKERGKYYLTLLLYVHM